MSSFFLCWRELVLEVRKHSNIKGAWLSQETLPITFAHRQDQEALMILKNERRVEVVDPLTLRQGLL